MRVALISEHASPLAALGTEDAGGQNAHVAELAVALAARGDEVRVYTRRDARDLPPEVSMAPGATVVHVPAGPPVNLPKDDLLPHMGAFADFLAESWTGGWAPDVAHAHFWMSGLAAVSAGRRVGVPVVQTFHALGTVKRRHQGTEDTSPPRRIGYERAIGRAVFRVIAQCGDEVSELDRLGIPRAQVAVVPPGVDLALFTPRGPVRPRDGRPRVLTVGRLVERKGFADIIDAMTVVPHAECLIIGGPPAGQLAADPVARRLADVAGARRVADRIRLVGAVPREEMPAWYRSADVVVCAPHYEPYGLTALEAMACGVPVVATAVGGLTDSVVDGVTGDLVARGDPRALGAAIRRMLDDPLRRMTYAAAAADRARRCFAWTRAAAQLGAVYAAAAASRPTSRVEVA